MMKDYKNIISLFLILVLQFPFLIEWEHNLSVNHIEYKQVKGKQIVKKSISSCYLLHKTPYGIFQQSSFYFIPKNDLHYSLHPVLKIRHKEYYLSTPYALRAPPFHFSILA